MDREPLLGKAAAATNQLNHLIPNDVDAVSLSLPYEKVGQLGGASDIASSVSG